MFLRLQVLFEDKRAVGVEMVRRSRKQVIRAKREVILSAGTFGSSKLLLLSGVGPKQHLNDMKVSVWESFVLMEILSRLLRLLSWLMEKTTKNKNKKICYVNHLAKVHMMISIKFTLSFFFQVCITGSHISFTR